MTTDRRSGSGVEIVNLSASTEQLELTGGVAVHGAPAQGLAMLTNGNLGADLLHVKAGDQFPVHTHPGDHLLYCVSGRGTITVNQVTYRIYPGDLYMVEGLIPHAVGAVTDHVILAIGSPHKPVDSPERMTFVDWRGNPTSTPLLAGDDTSEHPR